LLKVGPSQYDLIAADLVETYAKTVLANSNPDIVATCMGNDLVGSVFHHPYPDITPTSRAILGDHVTVDAGTGIVHIAPAHGEDDFNVWMAHVKMDGQDEVTLEDHHEGIIDHSIDLSLSLYHSMYVCMYQSIYRSFDLSLYLSIYLSLCLSIDLSLYRSLYLSIDHSIYV
jgi:hypothetical protein